MKKLIIFLLLLTIVSCSYDYDPWYQGSVTIESESVFSVNGKLYLYTTEFIPTTIYNPNNYEITVNCDGTDLTISSHDSLTIRSTL